MTAGSGAIPKQKSLLWVMLFLAAFTALILMASLSKPQLTESQLSVSEVLCRAEINGRMEADTRTLRLPFISGVILDAVDRVYHCHFELSLSDAEARSAVLMVPSYSDTIALHVNGRYVATTEVNRLRTLRFVTSPAYFPLQGLVHEGPNRFEFVVSSGFGRTVVLDSLYLGTEAKLRPIYNGRWFMTAVLPTMVAGAALAFAMLFGAIWWTRRDEAAYGWLALLLLLTGLHGSTIIPDFLPHTGNRSNWTLTVVWEGTANLLFVRRLLGCPKRNWEWLVFLPPLIVTILTLFVVRPSVLLLALPMGSATFIGFVLAATALLARESVKGNREALVILLAELTVLGFAIHDVLVTGHVLSSAIFFSRSAAAVFLLAPVLLMFRRLSHALVELDHTADTLRLRVAEVEHELRTTYEELRARREAALIGQERVRMMRDLHDGMGGEVATMLALAERPDPDTHEIAGHARAALADMRLIIASLEDYGGDLTLALGAWRERMEPQVRAAGMRLVWDIDDLPPPNNFSPPQILDLLRLLQEAVTNAVRHSGGTIVRVEGRMVDGAICLTVSDDGEGQGESKPGTGKGLASMKARADRLGSLLDVAFSPQGSRVSIRLP